MRARTILNGWMVRAALAVFGAAAWAQDYPPNPCASDQIMSQVS